MDNNHKKVRREDSFFWRMSHSKEIKRQQEILDLNHSIEKLELEIKKAGLENELIKLKPDEEEGE